MMRLIDWIEDRTGVGSLCRTLLNEPIPGGVRWRYVWGSTLAFVFLLQIVTGVLLMTTYSPSATTAWGSVWYIQTQMPLGWLIRGLHHFGSQAMVVLLPIHLLQVLVAKAYRAPRECTWSFGLVLLGLALGLSLSGYLLPWDQKGYWATRVSTNILGLTPVIGRGLGAVLVGGSEYGNATLTRFYALHVAVLPGLLGMFLVGHVALFRRHGVTVAPDVAGRKQGFFWPGQLLRDNLACLGVLCALLAVTWYTHGVMGDQLLDAPADPTTSDYPARPEWYFLFLFQGLKYFHGPVMEVIGAIVLPGLVMLGLFALPFLDRALPTRWAHSLAMAYVGTVLLGAALLTYASVLDDRNPAEGAVLAARGKLERGEPLTRADDAVLRAWQFNGQRTRARQLAERALVLAAEYGIPPEGPSGLLADDPMTQGPVLFAAHCAVCHRVDGHDGLGQVPPDPPTSSDLAGYASRTWIRGLLSDPMNERYFGRMVKLDGASAHTRMSRWIRETVGAIEDEVSRAEMSDNFDAVAAYLEDESRNPGRLAQASSAPTGGSAGMTPSTDQADDTLIRRGRAFFMGTCNECHSYAGEREGFTMAPEMLGYGSVDWIELMIAEPMHETRYRSRGKESAQMPPFKDVLSASERKLIAQWLHQSNR